jgi:hypothetical protein
MAMSPARPFKKNAWALGKAHVAAARRAADARYWRAGQFSLKLLVLATKVLGEAHLGDG